LGLTLIIPALSDIILVAVMPQKRDMEIARLLGWYRIPLRTAPKVIHVDYLAFYQTGSFGKNHRWRIEAIAEVRGHELTTREELFRDEGKHPKAHEEYYKVALGPVHPLPHPIFAEGWKRVTFLYTTGDLFCTAKTVNDLVVRSEDRSLLWRSLRERAVHAGAYRAAELSEIDLDPALLMMLGNIVQQDDERAE
jgi:hypothetical protein